MNKDQKTIQPESVTHQQQSIELMQSQLILSLFPGIDLLGKGFEEEGFSVVRGPDIMFGGDIREFHVPAGRFDGIIGGPPYPDLSNARQNEPTDYGLEMIAEYVRIVEEAQPQWWLMENVLEVPDVKIADYSHQRLDINARELGSEQNRHRHFQFGHRDGHLISIPRNPKSKAWQPCCKASVGKRTGKSDWLRFCRRQGLPDGIELPNLTLSARYRAVGSAVPLNMAKALASAVLSATPAEKIRLCGCGCGREITRRATYAMPACRKREQRRRETLIDPVKQIAM